MACPAPQTFCHNISPNIFVNLCRALQHFLLAVKSVYSHRSGSLTTTLPCFSDFRSTRKAIAKAKETHRSQFHNFWIRDFGLGTWTWDFGFLILHFGLLSFSFLRGKPQIPRFGFLIFDFRVLALLGRGLRTQNRPRVILELYERSQVSRFGFCKNLRLFTCFMHRKEEQHAL